MDKKLDLFLWPAQTKASVSTKPLQQDASIFTMHRNTTLPIVTNDISFKLERLDDGSGRFKISLSRQIDKQLEEIINTVEVGQEIEIPILPGARCRIEADGSLHITGRWPRQFNYQFETDGDCYIHIDEFESTGKTNIKARRLKVDKPIQAKELILQASQELDIPDVTTNESLSIRYAGDASHYKCGKVLSRDTFDIAAPNCELEFSSSIDAIGTVNINGKKIINRTTISSLEGGINLTSTSTDAYSIDNRGSLKAEQEIVFAGTGLIQRGEFATNSHIRFNVHNLNLQRAIKAGGNIRCNVPCEFVQGDQGSIEAGGEVLLSIPHSIQTNAKIEANGKIIVVVEGPPDIVFEPIAPLISHSQDAGALNITATRFINRGQLVTTQGGMLVIASLDARLGLAESISHGDISCAGDFIVHTSGLSLESGRFKVNGNLIINSDELRFNITATCEVMGDLEVRNISSGNFRYMADVIKVNGTLRLHFLQGVTLGQAINTPGNVDINVEAGDAQVLNLTAPIKANGWIRLISPEIEQTSDLETRGTVELASLSTNRDYTIRNAGTIKSTEGNITIHGHGFRHDRGTISSNHDVIVTVQHGHFASAISAATLELNIANLFTYVRNVFSAGNLKVILSKGITIKEPLHNATGAINITVKPGSTGDLLVLSPITTSNDGNNHIRIITPTRIVIGQKGTLQDISAGGELYIEASVIDNGWGRLFGKCGVHLKSAGEIISGEAIVTNKTYTMLTSESYYSSGAYPVVVFDDDFHNSNGALIASDGVLKTECTVLRNRHGEIYVTGNFDATTTPSIINLGGSITIGGNADFSITVVENRLVFEKSGVVDKRHGFRVAIANYPATNIPNIKINGCANFKGLNNYAGNVYIAGVNVTINPIVNPLLTTNYVYIYHALLPTPTEQEYHCSKIVYGTILNCDYHFDYWNIHGDYDHYYLKEPQKSAMTIQCPFCTPQATATHQGVISSGKSLSLTPKTLTLQGVVSSPIVSITDFTGAVIGLQDASIQLLPTKPFQQVHYLVDYARPSGLFKIAGPSSSTIMELTIPLQYEPVLPPVVVIHPNGFALNYKNLKLLYPPFAERQYITDVLMQTIGRGYLDENTTTPTQIHYQLRLNASEAREKYSANTMSLPSLKTNITKPVLVYQELAYQGPNGQETILSPVVWFPKSYDNPYARNGMGLVYGDHIYILGNLDRASTLYICGCIQGLKTIAAACKDKLTLSGIIEGETAQIASFEDNVEIISRVTRVHRSNGYDDRVIRARAEATRERLGIAAPKKDVVLQGAITKSVTRTEIEAGRQILDLPIVAMHQQIQYVCDDDTYGTITDTHTEQVVSQHISGNGTTTGEVSMLAEQDITLAAPIIQSHTARITSTQGQARVVDVTESHQHEEHLYEESSSWFGSDKEIESTSVSHVSKGAQFRVKSLTIAGKTVIKLTHIHSSADENILQTMGEVLIQHGKNTSCSQSVTKRESFAWQRVSSDSREDVTYSPSEFTGPIRIQAAKVQLDRVRGTTLAFMQHIIENTAPIEFNTLEEQHHHESHASEGPSAGLVALTTVVVGVLTAGSGTAAMLAAKASTELGSAMLVAGFSTACAQASVALLSNKGDPFKAIESLGKEESIKAIATSIISAGIMHNICDKLKLPKSFEPKEPMQHLQYNLARASVSAVLNMSINEEPPEKAILAGLADAAVSTAADITTQKIGGLYNPKTPGQKPIAYATHKLLHMGTGAATGFALKGKKGILPGAIGAGVAEMVAEALLPKFPAEEQIAAEKLAKGGELTSKEESAIRMEVVKKSADYAKITAAATSFLAHQDVNVAASTASSALEHNFMVTSMAAIQAQRDCLEQSQEEMQDEVEKIERCGTLEELHNFYGLEPYTLGPLEPLDLGDLPPTTLHGSELARSESRIPGTLVRGNLTTREPLRERPRGIFSMYQGGSGSTLNLGELPPSTLPSSTSKSPSRIKYTEHPPFIRQERHEATPSLPFPTEIARSFPQPAREKVKIFDVRGWKPLSSVTSVKAHQVRVETDKRGRMHYRATDDGRFSKSASELAREGFERRERGSKFDLTLPVWKYEQSTGFHHDFVPRLTLIGDPDIQLGPRGYVYQNIGASVAVSKEGLTGEVSFNAGGGLNLFSAEKQTTIGTARLDVDGPSIHAKAGGSVHFSKDGVDIGKEDELTIKWGSLKGKYETPKICAQDACARVTLELEIANGIGVKYGEGNKSYKQAGRLFGSITREVGAGLGLMLGGRVTLDYELPALENNTSAEIPCSLLGHMPAMLHAYDSTSATSLYSNGLEEQLICELRQQHKEVLKQLKQ